MLLNPKYDCFQWDTTKLSLLQKSHDQWTWTVCIVHCPEASDSTLCIKMNMKCSELELSWSSPSCVCLLSLCEIKTTVVRLWSRSAASSHLIPSCSDASEYSRYLPFWLRLWGLRRPSSGLSLSCLSASARTPAWAAAEPIDTVHTVSAFRPGQAGPGWAGPPSPSVTTALVPGRVRHRLQRKLHAAREDE